MQDKKYSDCIDVLIFVVSYHVSAASSVFSTGDNSLHMTIN